jgi:hypothetical protein
MGYLLFMRSAQYEVAQKAAMELAARIDKGGPDKANEMQARGLPVILFFCIGTAADAAPSPGPHLHCCYVSSVP